METQIKKSLEAAVIGASAGLIVGAINGAITATTSLEYLDNFLGNQAVMTGIASVAGMPKRSAEFAERMSGIGAANIAYRIGYYGSRALIGAASKYLI